MGASLLVWPPGIAGAGLPGGLQGRTWSTLPGHWRDCRWRVPTPLPVEDHSGQLSCSRGRVRLQLVEKAGSPSGSPPPLRRVGRGTLRLEFAVTQQRAGRTFVDFLNKLGRGIFSLSLALQKGASGRKAEVLQSPCGMLPESSSLSRFSYILQAFCCPSQPAMRDTASTEAGAKRGSGEWS